MIYYKTKSFAIFNLIVVGFFICNDTSIDNLKKEREKIQEQIKTKDKEIKELSSELKLLRKKITKTTNNLNTTTKEAIDSQKSLIVIDNDIKETQKILSTIEKDLSELDILIKRQKKNILEQEQKIDSTQNIIHNIEIDFKNRTQKTYKLGISETTNWANKKYLKRLNKYVDKNDKIKQEQYQSIVAELAGIKKSLESNLKELEISLISKQKLYDFKKNAIQSLISSRRKKEKLLKKLTDQKNDLENSLKTIKTTEQQKENAIESIKKKINQLLIDKEQNKKRTDELIRIRLENNKQISGNFSDMKGKLIWPTSGIIVSKFGNQLNKELKTITENIGIDIQCEKDASIVSVMDGIVSLISYIPGHGNIIIIDHGEGYSTVYANIVKISIYEEQYVKSGQIIAKTQSPTNSNKSLMHFEIWKKDKNLNPEGWLKKK